MMDKTGAFAIFWIIMFPSVVIFLLSRDAHYAMDTAVFMMVALLFFGELEADTQ